MSAALLITLLISALLSWWLAHTRGRLQILDTPNDRSLHTRSTPRTGGIAIMLGASAGLAVLWLQQGVSIASWPLYGAIIVLASAALTDDYRNLGIGPRLLVQIGIVAFLLFLYRSPGQGIIIDIVALIFLTWMINLYNFMDGMDGFAAGMSVIGFGTFALLGWHAGYVEFALGCATLTAACTGFLLFNFPPAKLFMGDVGSTVLGLLAGIAILQSHRDGLLPVWLGILIFSPFIVDATITLAIRILRREQFWKPHRSHCYQRLALAGWGHRRTVLAEYALMIACCGSALAGAALPSKGQFLLVGFWVLVYVTLIGLVHLMTKQRLARR